MGKKTKLREAQRRAAEHAMAARLREHSGPKNRPGFIESYSDFPPELRERIERYRAHALRAPESWRCGLRARDPERRFLDLVRFCFGRYRIARHLENAWVTEPQGDANAIALPGGDFEEEFLDRADYRRWYIAAAQGQSLHRLATYRYMTRLETHHFVHAPDEVSDTQRAFWYAFARARTHDVDVAVRIARTKLANLSVECAFWQNAARFFARNPTGVIEMNDLIDFFDAAWQADEDFSLAGRTLPALRERMNEWHRALRHTPDGLSWYGADLPDVAYEVATADGRCIWRFRQIRTDHELFQEGERMAHCVATYRYHCTMGALSIWSLTCETADGVVHPHITIELSRSGAITQCRGKYNRAPTAEEAAMIRRWVGEYGLTLDAWELEAA